MSELRSVSDLSLPTPVKAGNGPAQPGDLLGAGPRKMPFKRRMEVMGVRSFPDDTAPVILEGGTRTRVPLAVVLVEDFSCGECSFHHCRIRDALLHWDLILRAGEAGPPVAAV